LLEQGHGVVLIDISQGMLNQAKKLLNNFSNIEFHKESATNLKNSDGEFEVVIMMNAILDYCGDHHKAVKEVYEDFQRLSKRIAQRIGLSLPSQFSEAIEIN